MNVLYDNHVVFTDSKENVSEHRNLLETDIKRFLARVVKDDLWVAAQSKELSKLSLKELEHFYDLVTNS